MTSVGPYSTHAALRRIDKRTRPARLVTSLRNELTAHIGVPTIDQQVMIDEACELKLRIAIMDSNDDPANFELSQRNQVQRLAWSGAFTRLIRDIIQGYAAPEPERRIAMPAGFED